MLGVEFLIIRRKQLAGKKPAEEAPFPQNPIAEHSLAVRHAHADSMLRRTQRERKLGSATAHAAQGVNARLTGQPLGISGPKKKRMTRSRPRFRQSPVPFPRFARLRTKFT
jgi:hypothetical protein